MAQLRIEIDFAASTFPCTKCKATIVPFQRVHLISDGRMSMCSLCAACAETLLNEAADALVRGHDDYQENLSEWASLAREVP